MSFVPGDKVEEILRSQIPCMTSVAEINEAVRGNIPAIHEVPRSEVSSNGVIDPGEHRGTLIRIRVMFVNRLLDRASSKRMIAGRYILGWRYSLYSTPRYRPPEERYRSPTQCFRCCRNASSTHTRSPGRSAILTRRSATCAPRSRSVSPMPIISVRSVSCSPCNCGARRGRRRTASRSPDHER